MKEKQTQGEGMNEEARFQRRGPGPLPPLIMRRQEKVLLWRSLEVRKRAVEGVPNQSPLFTVK